jgi:three-Cys-motif partner protein
LAGPKTTTWDLEPQTKAKHDILRGYLGGWFGKMGNTYPRIIFLDAFAGPGRYSDGSPGSPIIALETLLKHRVVESKCEFVLMFNENHPDRYTYLDDLLKEFIASNPLPLNVKILLRNKKFTELSAEIATHLEKAKASIAPTLAFVDPFGFSETPISALQQVLMYPGCEVLTYLNTNGLNRFGTAGNVDPHLGALFGNDAFKSAPPSGDPERIPYFVGLYEEQLKSECNFKYTWSFQMRNTSGLAIYSLVFATSNIKGLALMKDVMWKVAPGGAYTFHAKYSSMDVLFELDVDYPIIAAAIKNQFTGQRVRFPEVSDFVLTDTPFLESHVRKSLNILERAGQISVIVHGRNRRHETYPGDSLIVFQ